MRRRPMLWVIIHVEDICDTIFHFPMSFVYTKNHVWWKLNLISHIIHNYPIEFESKSVYVYATWMAFLTHLVQSSDNNSCCQWHVIPISCWKFHPALHRNVAKPAASENIN